MAHDCLKDEQKKVILKILEGNQCFISLQTGYGKSLIFQVLPFAIVFEYYRRYEDIPLLTHFSYPLNHMIVTSREGLYVLAVCYGCT